MALVMAVTGAVFLVLALVGSWLVSLVVAAGTRSISKGMMVRRAMRGMCIGAALFCLGIFMFTQGVVLWALLAVVFGLVLLAWTVYVIPAVQRMMGGKSAGTPRV